MEISFGNFSLLSGFAVENAEISNFRVRNDESFPLIYLEGNFVLSCSDQMNHLFGLIQWNELTNKRVKFIH